MGRGVGGMEGCEGLGWVLHLGQVGVGKMGLWHRLVLEGVALRILRWWGAPRWVVPEVLSSGKMGDGGRDLL